MTTRRRPIQSLLGRALIHLSARLSFRSVYALGGMAGRLLAALPGRAALVTRCNLALCFPELTSAEQRALARRSLAETARMALELGRVWLGPIEETLALVREVEGDAHLEAALARGRGALLAVPHLGSWELLGLYLASRWPMTTLYRPPRAREMERFYRACRERTGARLVPAGPSGIRALVRTLRNGELVAVLPDQDPGRGAGVFVPFFGVAANTSVLISRLAAKCSAPVLFVWCERLPDARGFRVHFVPGGGEIAAGDVARAAQALNQGIEECIRTLPHQYLWSYKRFRFRPAGSPRVYPRGLPQALALLSAAVLVFTGLLAPLAWLAFVRGLGAELSFLHVLAAAALVATLAGTWRLRRRLGLRRRGRLDFPDPRA